jgi:hypothetical protein
MNTLLVKRRILIQITLLLLSVATLSGYIGYRIGRSRLPQGPPPYRTVAETLAGLTQELDLSAAQVEQVRPILQRRSDAQAEHSRILAARMGRFAEEMRGVLDERQRAIFDERTERIRNEARKQRQSGGAQSPGK